MICVDSIPYAALRPPKPQRNTLEWCVCTVFAAKVAPPTTTSPTLHSSSYTHCVHTAPDTSRAPHAGVSGAAALWQRSRGAPQTLHHKQKHFFFICLTHTNLQTETGLLCVCVCVCVLGCVWRPTAVENASQGTSSSYSLDRSLYSAAVLRGGIPLRPPPHSTICNM